IHFLKIHSEVFLLKKQNIHLKYFPGKGIGRCDSASFLSPDPNPFHHNAFYMYKWLRHLIPIGLRRGKRRSVSGDEICRRKVSVRFWFSMGGGPRYGAQTIKNPAGFCPQDLK
ncbi:hypothetical protein, partial [Aedoeadaptatus coxii]|uniref:hypothetical protein n=1 Tax=Aedoeadaptatus coxii TaxID=755172 RepID=UPI002AA2ADDF